LTLDKSRVLFDNVIVRLGGEIGIKGVWTKRIYERRLIRNIKATLRHHSISYDAVLRRKGRIYVKTNQAQKAAGRLTRVFGISSLSPASQTTGKLEDITCHSLSVATQSLRKQSSFAVRCRRVGTHPYTSREVCEHIGRQILESFPKLQLTVNLNSPSVTLGIEIREDQAFIFTDIISAADGLPIGTQPKAIIVVKPDQNSPVACWLTMKRGCPSVPAYFNQNQDKSPVRHMRKVCGALFEWSIGHPAKLYIIPHSENLAKLKSKCAPRLLEIVSKRLIYRLAAHIAEKERAEAIVTGETIDENPCETLRYFRLQDQATPDYPIYRPLAGLTDAEIKKLARKIGIQRALSAKPEQSGAPKPRETVLPTLKEVEAAEDKLPISKMIGTTLQKLETTIIKGGSDE